MLLWLLNTWFLNFTVSFHNSKKFLYEFSKIDDDDDDNNNKQIIMLYEQFMLNMVEIWVW